MPIAVSLIIYGAFDVIIDIGPFEHLGKIERDPVEDHPCLRVSANMFATRSSDGRCASHQLSDDENNYYEDKHRNEQLREGETFGRSLRRWDCEWVPGHLLTAMNVWTDPAGVTVAGSTWAGQLTIMFATDVDALGGNKYVIFDLNVAPAGGLPLSWSQLPC